GPPPPTGTESLAIRQRHPAVAPQQPLPRVGMFGGPRKEPLDHDLTDLLRWPELDAETRTHVVRVDQRLVAPHRHEPGRVGTTGGVIAEAAGRGRLRHTGQDVA